MRLKTTQGSKIENSCQLEDIKVVSAAHVRKRGNRFYPSVRPRDVEFWGIKSGDEVLMEHTKLKRYDPLSRALMMMIDNGEAT